MGPWHEVAWVGASQSPGVCDARDKGEGVWELAGFRPGARAPGGDDGALRCTAISTWKSRGTPLIETHLGWEWARVSRVKPCAGV